MNIISNTSIIESEDIDQSIDPLQYITGENYKF